MFKLNQIDDEHIQFSMCIEDSRFESESLIDAIYEYSMSDKNKFGCFGYGETIKLSEVSHNIDEIHVDEENGWIYGILKVLDTPNGKRIKEFMKNNIIQYLQLDINGFGHRDSEDEKQKIDNILSINFINP